MSLRASSERGPRDTDVLPPLFLLYVVSKQASNRLAPPLRQEGYSVEEWHVLDHLARHGDLPMTAVAEALMIPAPSLTRLMERLVGRSLVARVGDPFDRRRVLVRLSARGQSAHRRLAGVVAAADAEGAAILTREQLETLRTLLAQLHVAFSADPERA